MNIPFHISIEIYLHIRKKKYINKLLLLRGSCFLSSFYPNESNCPLAFFHFVHLEARILENASIPVCQDTSERMYYIVQVNAKSQNQHIYIIIHRSISKIIKVNETLWPERRWQKVLIEDPGPQVSTKNPTSGTIYHSSNVCWVDASEARRSSNMCLGEGPSNFCGSEILQFVSEMVFNCWTENKKMSWYLFVVSFPTGWCPPVISWFINPINYSYIYHKP